LLSLCQWIDKVQKGIEIDNIWDRLIDLTLGLAVLGWPLSAPTEPFSITDDAYF
jgi:hypothetical protein